MKNFKKIAVVFDVKKDNNMALAHAAELAKSIGSELVILCPTPTELSDQNKQTIIDHINNFVKQATQTIFLVGKPIEQILQYTEEQNVDMLILEPMSQNGLRQFFFGSLPLFLVRRAPCPVWIVKKPLPATHERVLIAVDPLHDRNGSASLNDKLIEIGTFFAKHENAESHLVSAWYLPAEGTMLDSPFIHTPEEQVIRMRNEAEKECKEAYENMLARNKDYLKDTTTHLIHGEPGVAIPKFIEKQGIDIIVMGTVARTGLKGFIIGNAAEAILNQIECSVIAIKPDSFK